MALNGKSVKGNDIEVIYRDLPAANPAQSRALAQELVVKDKVQYLGGVYFTPDAMADHAAACSGQHATRHLQCGDLRDHEHLAARGPHIVHHGTDDDASRQGRRRRRREEGDHDRQRLRPRRRCGERLQEGLRGRRRAGGGIDPHADEHNRFQPDHAARARFRRRGVFAFLPSGPPTLGFAKAYNETGLKKAGIKFFAPGDLTQESDLPALGDAADGLKTSFHYAVSHDFPENKKFVEAATKAIGSAEQLSFPAVGAYDGMHVIYKMIEATGGKQDAQKAVDAVKGLSWTSPRGPVNIDPATRHITQNIYLREVAKGADGKSINKEIQTFPNQKDPGLATQ